MSWSDGPIDPPEPVREPACVWCNADLTCVCDDEWDQIQEDRLADL